jgi:hypothetical protein
MPYAATIGRNTQDFARNWRGATPPRHKRG